MRACVHVLCCVHIYVGCGNSVMRDQSQNDAREVVAQAADLNFIGLDGLGLCACACMRVCACFYDHFIF